MTKLQKTKDIIKMLPEKKHYLDFIAALLTLPVLITVLLLNLGNLKKPITQSPAPTPTPVNYQATTTVPQVRIVQTSIAPQPTISGYCTNGIGQIAIVSPQENQTTNTNPVCVNINYDAGNYCGVVWKYKVNGGTWSDYGNNSVCLYDLPSGQNVFELQTKSLVSNSVKTIERTFTYSPKQVTPTATPIITFTPTPTSSASASQ